MAMIGKVAFIIGFLLAIFGGIWGGIDVPTNRAIIAILLVAGVLIGFLNITAKETTQVLAAVVALIVISIWSVTAAFLPVRHLSQGLYENVIGLLDAFALLMAPAAIIIAIKAVIATGKPGD
jgi:hypothetical protein